MTPFPHPPVWPAQFTQLIESGDWETCLQKASHLVTEEPTNTLGFEISVHLFMRLWLFRTARQFIETSPSNIIGQSEYLRNMKYYLTSEMLPMHAGLPVITSDAPCVEWLPKDASGIYPNSEENSKRFADDILSLEAFVANGFAEEQLTRNMGSIYRKTQYLMQNINFTNVRVLADLGGFDGLAAWLLLQYFPNIERVILADSVFPENAPEVFKKSNVPIEFIQTNLLDLDPTIFAEADTFLLNDVVEHIPESPSRTILQNIKNIRSDAQIFIYTPTLNHNNLERFSESISELSISLFDFWFWNGAVLSPRQINHVPAHLSYKSPGWLWQICHEMGFKCQSELHLASDKAISSRIYLSASLKYSGDLWSASGIEGGVKQFQL